MPSMRPTLPLLAAALAGCSPDLTALAAVEVREAWIEDLALTSVALIGGACWGRGELVVLGQQGEHLEVPLKLRGGMVGAAFDFSRETPELDLELPDTPIRADRLLGGYRGSGEQITIFVGVEVRHLHNDHGVGIDQASLTEGLAVMFAYEWLKLRLDDEPSLGEDTGWDQGDPS
ncbi:MAG: hypothetical protein ABIO70_15840 [Pseudomonadota bacterium]